MTTTEQHDAPLVGLNAYQKKLHGASSREDILLALNKGIYDFLAAAKFSYEQDSLDKMCLSLEKATRIILSLKGHFSLLEQGEDTALLQRYYGWFFKKSVLIHKVDNPSREIDTLLSIMRDFCVTLEGATRPARDGQNLPTRANTVA